MTQPDPATGLPQLPEGQWWEVKRNEYFSYMGVLGAHHLLPASDAGYRVSIKEWRHQLETVEPGAHWWSAPIVTPARDIDHTVASRDITGPKGLADNLTARLIRKAAYSLMHDRNRHARSNALLGVYPPNTLPAK